MLFFMFPIFYYIIWFFLSIFMIFVGILSGYVWLSALGILIGLLCLIKLGLFCFEDKRRVSFDGAGLNPETIYDFVEKGELTVGSASNADIYIKDPSTVSPKHCVLEFRNKRFVLKRVAEEPYYLYVFRRNKWVKVEDECVVKFNMYIKVGENDIKLVKPAKRKKAPSGRSRNENIDYNSF